MSSLVNLAELNELAARFGTPLLWQRTLDVSIKTFNERREKNAKRNGEVALAMPRPAHRVLIHTKSFYPPGCFRLLSGGIETGESVESAARREILEETSLDAAPARLLGIVEYEFRHQADKVGFVSFVFLTTETAGTPRVLDPHEQITDFREVAWSELDRVADRLESLPGDWHAWGVFRAIPHRLVLQAIYDNKLEL